MVADDDDYFRIAMRGILTEQLAFPTVYETQSLDAAIDVLGTHKAVELALFDLNMPGLDTFSGIRATREAFPDVTVAVVSASRRRGDVLRALEAGAHGFVPKGEGVKHLVAAVQAVTDGAIYVPGFVTDVQSMEDEMSLSQPDLPAARDDELGNVTPRQREVLECVVRGLSNKEIARALSISESAAKFHIASLCGRLRVKNRTEIAARASRVIGTPRS